MIFLWIAFALVTTTAYLHSDPPPEDSAWFQKLGLQVLVFGIFLALWPWFLGAFLAELKDEDPPQV